jgi:UV DNA damage endonuclease
MLNLKLGLCCISLKLQEKGVKSSTMTKTRFFQLQRKDAEKTLADRTLNNIMTIHKTLELCASKNWNYRISSGVMPLSTLPELNLSMKELYNYDKIKQEFDICSDIITKNKIRCSTHPDQFVVTASSNPDTAKKSVNELIMHGEIMDMLGLPQSYNSPINIHMNCFKGSPLSDIADRFIDIYNTLPATVKSRLVLENEDKPNSWNVQQLYEHVYQRTGIPITYDNLHHKCNPGKLNAKKAIKLAKSTWNKYIPLFHFSDSDKNSTNIRSHADYPSSFADEYQSFDGELHLELEFKAKDYAIEKFETDFELKKEFPLTNAVCML